LKKLLEKGKNFNASFRGKGERSQGEEPERRTIRKKNKAMRQYGGRSIDSILDKKDVGQRKKLGEKAKLLHSKAKSTQICGGPLQTPETPPQSEFQRGAKVVGEEKIVLSHECDSKFKRELDS